MKCMPFFDELTGSESKLDLKAIYSRPGTGVNLTSPLPLRRHKDWAAKGYTFVSVATMSDLGLVAPFLRKKGRDPLVYRECFDPITGDFRTDLYVQQAAADRKAYVSELQSKVAAYGAETVVEMMRVSDPSFVLPAEVEVAVAVSDKRGKPQKDAA